MSSHGGYVLPSETIAADLNFATPFEGIPELSITLAIALLDATKQIAPDSLSDVTLVSNLAPERIRLRAA